MDNLSVPPKLSKKGTEAYKVIMAYLKKHDHTRTGGCRAFYSPKEWQVRGEEYGTKSELLVVYDGGDLRYCFSLDACYETGAKDCYSLYEGMQAELEKIGLYFEECTCWYSAIYSR